ncbi:MAG: metallopeptidase TldD-related protein, partial [Myxococcota bacterium]
ERVNLYADAREAGGAGGFGFDDEGVEAQRVDLVVDGRFVGYLTSRETAQRVGLESSSGAMRAAGWETSPQVRCTNLCLAPSEDGDLDALINDTERGVLIDGPKAILLDPGGGSFIGQGEVAWRIENGKKIERLRNPIYRGTHPGFWRGCDAVCGPDSFRLFGSLTTKARGERPIPVGHGAAPARFTNVELGAQTSLPRVENSVKIPTIDQGSESSRARREDVVRNIRRTPPPSVRSKKRRVRRKDVR